MDFKNKADQVALKFRKFGLTEYWDEQDLYYLLDKLKVIETFAQYRLVFQDLQYAFIFLALGLALSMTLFMFGTLRKWSK